MPRPGPRRTQAGFRAHDGGLKVIEGLAEEAGVDLSEMIRRLLTESLARRGYTAKL